jgi:diguanylate cyclase (GGDEF)-like protein/PAS domain S-box-containing protein
MTRYIKNLIRFYKTNPLSLRILLYILSFSALFAVMTTLLQLYSQYRLDVDLVEDRISDIRQGTIPVLRESLWKFDLATVRNNLDAIQGLHYIRFLSLSTPDGALMEAGTLEQASYQIERIDIDYTLPDAQVIPLGTLTLYVDYSVIFNNLLIQLGVTLAAQLIKTFSVSIFILLILHFMLMRHLSALAGFADNLSFKTLNHKLSLKRKSVGKIPDELEKVASSLENMRKRLLDDLKTIEEAKETEQKLINTIEASPSGMLICTPDKRIEYMNESFRRLTSLKDDIIGDDILKISSMLPHPTTEDYDLGKILEHVFIHDNWSGEAIGTKADGDSCWIYLIVSTIRNQKGNISHILLIIDDITDLKQYEENLFRQTNFDESTRLPNRRYAFDRMVSILDIAKARDQMVGVVLLSIKEYWGIKGTLGEKSADELMSNLAEQLQKYVSGVSLFARMGEHELLICFENMESRNIIELELRKLTLQLMKPLYIQDRLTPVSLYAGIALYPSDGESVQELYKNALVALEKARKSPVNYHFYNEELGKSVSRQYVIARSLRNATLNNELSLNYQPIINATDLQISGYEVLIRWNNPELGNISPVEFISIAEKTGEIIAIGKWIIEQALSDTQELLRDNNKTLSINISPVQFLNPDFEKDISNIIEKTATDPIRLKLEITEELLIESAEVIDKKVSNLKKLGIHIVLDDFGTGYSSLSYLQNITFDVLKIDKAFVMDMDKNPQNDTLVKTIIGLAHNLNMKVTAEGVETIEHVNKLREYGCDLLQGYYFSKPVTLSELHNKNTNWIN